MALLYEDQNRNRRALNVLESLAEDYPDDPAILNAYGYLLTDRFDRHDEARDYIERALALNPDSAAIIDSMGWVLYKLGDYGTARDYLERAYRLEQDPEIAAHLVDVRWQLGELDSARELLRQSLETNPDSRHLQEVSERLAP
ncbi:Lipopolysaccharide assembly protein B [compost metagenome]